MPFSIAFAGASRLYLILGIQPQGNAQLVECHVDPVSMNLDFCDHGKEKCTQVLRIEILPAGGKPRSLVQKRLLADGIGAMTLNLVFADDIAAKVGAAKAVANASVTNAKRNFFIMHSPFVMFDRMGHMRITNGGPFGFGIRWYDGTAASPSAVPRCHNRVRKGALEVEC